MTPHIESTGQARQLLGLPGYVILFVCAALPPLVYLFIARPLFTYEHWDMAGSLLQNGTLGFAGVPTTRFEPLYPLLIASLRTATGDRMIAAQIFQVAIGSIAAISLFRLTETLTASRRAALIAAALFACYPLSIRHAADGTDATLMATLLITFCSMFVRVHTAARAAMAGVCLGLVTLTRTMALPLVALAALLLLKERRPRSALALTISALALFAPYGIRNYALNGAILPTRTGLNLLVSNSQYTQALVPAYHADFLEAYAESLLARDGIGSSQPMTPALERQQDLALAHHAWADMSRRPGELIWLRAKYTGYFFAPFLVPSHLHGEAPEVHLEKDGRASVTDSPLRPLWECAAYTLSYLPVLALALGGAVRRRHDVRRDAILWSVVATFVAAHSILFPATHYRVPMEFVLLFYAAIELDALAGRTLTLRQHAHPQIA